MSLMLMSISSTPWLVMISNAGIASRAHRSPPCARRACLRATARAASRGCELDLAGRCSLGRSASAGRLWPLGPRRHQQVEQALFRVQLGLVGDFFQLLFAHHVDRDIHQVADHRFHIAPHIADFGELAGFDFQERRIRELRQAARNLGFAHAGGPDHDDVLRHDSSAISGVSFCRRMRLRSAIATARLASGWPTTYLSSSRDDFARRQFVEHRLLFIRGCG